MAVRYTSNWGRALSSIRRLLASARTTIEGPELINAAKASDATILTGLALVASIDGMGITFSVGESQTQEITARNIIIASGAADTSDRVSWLDINGCFLRQEVRKH